MIYDEIYHHGIQGMKWGVRRYQNADGTLTPAGEKRYAKQIRKAEKRAVNRNPSNKAALRPYRDSTGANFDKASEAFRKSWRNDKEYMKLSQRAFEIEKKRLLFEKPYYEASIREGTDRPYEELWKNKEYRKLNEQSIAAKKAKDAYADKKAREYVDTIKEAKLKDLGFTDNIDVAKKYVSDKWNRSYYDDYNLDYNPDTFYDGPWVEKETFKRS